MSLRYLLDEDMSPAVVEGLRLRGIDAVSVHDLGRANHGVLDATWLEEAAADGMTLGTYNRADFQELDNSLLPLRVCACHCFVVPASMQRQKSSRRVATASDATVEGRSS